MWSPSFSWALRSKRGSEEAGKKLPPWTVLQRVEWLKFSSRSPFGRTKQRTNFNPFRHVVPKQLELPNRHLRSLLTGFRKKGPTINQRTTKRYSLCPHSFLPLSPSFGSYVSDSGFQLPSSGQTHVSTTPDTFIFLIHFRLQYLLSPSITHPPARFGSRVGVVE